MKPMIIDEQWLDKEIQKAINARQENDSRYLAGIKFALNLVKQQLQSPA